MTADEPSSPDESANPQSPPSPTQASDDTASSAKCRQNITTEQTVVDGIKQEDVTHEDIKQREVTFGIIKQWDSTFADIKPREATPEYLNENEEKRIMSTKSIKTEPGVNSEDDDNCDVDSAESPTVQQLMRHLQLPNDVLFLKKINVTMHGNSAVCWVVCCAIPLPKGSSLGPFQGEITLAEKVKVGDMILQVGNLYLIS